MSQARPGSRNRAACFVYPVNLGSFFYTWRTDGIGSRSPPHLVSCARTAYLLTFCKGPRRLGGCEKTASAGCQDQYDRVVRSGFYQEGSWCRIDRLMLNLNLIVYPRSLDTIRLKIVLIILCLQNHTLPIQIILTSSCGMGLDANTSKPG